VSRDSDEDLIIRSVREPEAFGAFYARHEDAILAYMLRRTRDRELAADLAAETFAAALLSARRFRRRPEPAIAWLFGIARNVLGRSLERRRVEDRARVKLGMRPVELTDRDLSAIDALLDDVTVEQVLSTLPEGQAEAIRARVFEDEDYEAIARRLQCSPMVVRKRVSRGLAALRTQMKDAS
jgi:RNA polymerase sigma factor (sigma-70 family)